MSAGLTGLRTPFASSSPAVDDSPRALGHEVAATLKMFWRWFLNLFGGMLSQGKRADYGAF
jgi:hypothetical protein